MLQWAKKATQEVLMPITCIGTGGNIKKLFSMSKNSPDAGMTKAELRGLKGYLSEFKYEERVNLLKLNPDRADVILPAADIFIKIMKAIKANTIRVPNVGLKDGLLYDLYEDIKEEKMTVVEFLDM